MGTKILHPKLSDAFINEFSETAIKHSKCCSLFCNLLLKVIDVDIHSINLTILFEEPLTSIENNEEVQKLQSAYDFNILDGDNLTKEWLLHFLPRLRVFFYTTTFSGKRIDDDSIDKCVFYICTKSGINDRTYRKIIEQSNEKLSLLKRKCKDDDWYYDVSNILDWIGNNVCSVIKQNTLPLFFTIMNALEPKFIDDLRDNFGTRMSMSFMLGMNKDKKL